MNGLSERLKEARLALGLKQPELSKAIGAKLRGYQENESGRSTPRSDVITGFIGLGVNANWLLTGNGEMLIRDDGDAEFQKAQQTDAILAMLDNDVDAEKRVYERGEPRVQALAKQEKDLQDAFAGLGYERTFFWDEKLKMLRDSGAVTSSDIAELVNYIKNRNGSAIVDVTEFNEEYALIPGYHISVSAGHGALNNEHEVKRQLAFRTKWLRYRKLNPKDLAVVFAKGDSMEPTINSGNTILVNLVDKKLTEGSIYVLRLGEDLYAKRLQQRFDGSIELISDNKEYSTQLVKPDELEQLEIIGKVVWIGKDLY